MSIRKRPVVLSNRIAPVYAAALQNRPALLRDIRDGVRHFRLADDSRFLCTENARLLTTNTFAIRAQPVSMIKRNTGDYSDIGIDDIGGVKAAA